MKSIERIREMEEEWKVVKEEDVEDIKKKKEKEFVKKKEKLNVIEGEMDRLWWRVNGKKKNRVMWVVNGNNVVNGKR